ncbi:MAG: hypothetical protein QW726_06420 [Fervidicoccaceae archaeon]
MNVDNVTKIAKKYGALIGIACVVLFLGIIFIHVRHANIIKKSSNLGNASAPHLKPQLQPQPPQPSLSNSGGNMPPGVNPPTANNTTNNNENNNTPPTILSINSKEVKIEKDGKTITYYAKSMCDKEKDENKDKTITHHHVYHHVHHHHIVKKEKKEKTKETAHNNSGPAIGKISIVCSGSHVCKLYYGMNSYKAGDVIDGWRIENIDVNSVEFKTSDGHTKIIRLR